MKILNEKIGTKKHLIFLDFEGTQYSHEMIAIGAVRVDLKNDRTIKKVYPGFKRYVLAKERIGKFVTELTGISEETLSKEGIHFGVMQEQLKKYIKITYDKCVFVTFGTHDIRILNQTVQHNLSCDVNAVKTMCKNYLDMSDLLGEFVRDEHGNCYSLLNYLKIFGGQPEGDAHDPLYDAINLVNLYDLMMKNPQILEKNYKTQLKRKSHYPYPVQAMLNSILEGKSFTPEDFEKAIKEYIEK